jgi:nicotinamide phosphoribosyltransferase
MRKTYRALCFKTDSYKASHYLQFPEGTESAFYYIESRSPGT